MYPFSHICINILIQFTCIMYCLGNKFIPSLYPMILRPQVPVTCWQSVVRNISCFESCWYENYSWQGHLVSQLLPYVQPCITCMYMSTNSLNKWITILIVFTIMTRKFYTIPLLGKYLRSNMISVGTERQELSKFISVEMIITGNSVLCWVELKKRKDLWTHSHMKFMYFCRIQHNVCAHVYTPTYILFSFNI